MTPARRSFDSHLHDVRANRLPASQVPVRPERSGSRPPGTTPTAAATAPLCRRWFAFDEQRRTGGKSQKMNSIIYIVGLVVIVLAILGFLGLR